MANYTLFYKGVASTPHTAGLMNLDTKEIICQIDTMKETGKETRKYYNKIMGLLKEKYGTLVN